jgi:hypothetical protein
MADTPRTLKQLQQTIRAARDSVWVISDEIAKLTTRGQLTNEGRGNIERNVGHLKLVVADTEITESGEDISDLAAGIVSGEQVLENNPPVDAAQIE